MLVLSKYNSELLFPLKVDYRLSRIVIYLLDNINFPLVDQFHKIPIISKFLPLLL